MSSQELKRKAEAALQEATDLGLVLEKNPKIYSGFKHIRRQKSWRRLKRFEQPKFIAEIKNCGGDIYKWKKFEPTQGPLKATKIGIFDTAEEAAVAFAKYLVKMKLKD